ncbi:MAG: hypothetical protein IKS77_03310, partial [Spirochaetales bacterium]|nr:hypothetical protein [Spirochaetales bacterium]
MKKLFMILALVLSLALIISCSPDQLTKAGQLMYKLSDAGLVSRNSKYVDAAAENVKLFIEESEKAFDWPVDMTPTTYDVAVSFRDDAAKASYVSTVDKTVELLLAAPVGDHVFLNGPVPGDTVSHAVLGNEGDAHLP